MTSPLLRGKIYSHKKFTFQDGGQADKLLILVNEPTGTTDWIFVKTTSQPKPKDTQGCHSTHNLYVLNLGEDFFRKKTWVQFHELYPFNHQALLKAKLGGDIQEKGQLREQTTRALLNCMRKSEDLSPVELGWLK